MFLLMKFREDTPHRLEHISMGRYLSKLTGRKVFCGWLKALWQHPENEFIRDEILATMEPVYIEPPGELPSTPRRHPLDIAPKRAYIRVPSTTHNQAQHNEAARARLNRQEASHGHHQAYC